MRDVFVARQPIFDRRHDVVAYELLYRRSAGAESAGEGDPAEMSLRVIADSIVAIGLDRLAGAHPAFINVNADLLITGDLEQLLDPQRVVLEILETVQPTPEVLGACVRLREAGFRLAVDDFVYDESYDALLDLCEFVKVDVLAEGHRLEKCVARLKNRPSLKLLAEKVETQEMHERCAALGFELFQGLHYLGPTVVASKDLPPSSLTLIRLLNLIRTPATHDPEIEHAFRGDPTLALKLLRIVNSAALGGRGVDSLGHAIRVLGRDALYRWASLLLLTAGGGRSEMSIEVMKSSLIRGKMCEQIGLLALRAGTRDVLPSSTLFLIGLFSHLDTLLGIPLPQILETISMAPEAKAAILDRTGTSGTILRGVMAYCDADWTGSEQDFRAVGVDPDLAADLFLDAISWAGDSLAPALDEAA